MVDAPLWQNRIFLNKKLCNPEEFILPIQDGYRDERLFLSTHKKAIIDIIYRFFEQHAIQVRYIIQATVVYNRFISLTNHIIALRKEDVIAKIREERKKTITEKEQPFAHFIIENELLDITNGIVPYFYRTNKNNHLYHASGAYRENFFDCSLWDEVYAHIMNLSDAEETIQTDREFIATALKSTAGIVTFEDFKKKFNFKSFDFSEKAKNLS